MCKQAWAMRGWRVTPRHTCWHATPLSVLRSQVPKSGTANSIEEALAIAADIGRYPLIIRPAFTCGGTGGGIAYNVDEFKQIVQEGIDASMTNQVLVEMSLIGWKEFELEVMRDLADNVVIICSIENVDPMGVHTGAPLRPRSLFVSLLAQLGGRGDAGSGSSWGRGDRVGPAARR